MRNSSDRRVSASGSLFTTPVCPTDVCTRALTPLETPLFTSESVEPRPVYSLGGEVPPEEPPDDDELPPDDDELPPDDDELPPDEDELPPDDELPPPLPLPLPGPASIPF